jgi:uncharacterized protein YcfJ
VKRIALVSFLVAATLSVHAQAYVGTARVIGVDPQYDSVRVPRQECSIQWVSEQPRRGGGPVSRVGGSCGTIGAEPGFASS